MGSHRPVKPDFSGEFVLNRAASTLSELGAANVQTASLRINHDEPTFRCEGTFTFLDGENATWAFELSSDGGNTPQGEGESSIRWDGDIVVARLVTPGPIITFRYELEPEGRLRVVEQLRGTDHDQDNIWMFDRR